MIPDVGGGSFINGDEALKRTFINRGDELKMIDSAFEALLDEERLLRTPIIDFFGVDGIGKTSILQEVKKRCQTRDLSCIWVDASQSPEDFLFQLLSQTKHLGESQPEMQEKLLDLYAQTVQAMKVLLEKGPVVVLLDAVDPTSEEEISRIETILYDLIDNPNLFVILSSKQRVSFDQHRSIARKLTPYQLKPFNQTSSESYLSNIAGTIEPAVRETIIAWTHGYPLAMKVMSQAIQEKQLDPNKPEDQPQLISLIMERVVDQGIFSRVEPEQLEWYKAYISLLSLPRRFNLVILQELTERFALALAPAGKLEYMGLPKQLNRGTDVLYWDMRRAGFTVDETVRHLFLKQRAIEHPALFSEIHQFLADRNKVFADQVSGSDHIRYLREYLYHSIFVTDAQALPQFLEQTVQHIVQESPDSFVQFSEELDLDEELKEALGPHLGTIKALIDEISERRDG